MTRYRSGKNWWAGRGHHVRLGQKRTCAVQNGMSALPPKADMCRALIHVRYGPKADISRKRVSSQLFDNFVSDRKHTRWNGRPQGWLKHKLEFSSLAHRHIGGPFIFKNPLWGLAPHWRGEYGRGLGPRRPPTYRPRNNGPMAFIFPPNQILFQRQLFFNASG
jgi:hypothetical protein